MYPRYNNANVHVQDKQHWRENNLHSTEATIAGVELSIRVRMLKTFYTIVGQITRQRVP